MRIEDRVYNTYCRAHKKTCNPRLKNLQKMKRIWEWLATSPEGKVGAKKKHSNLRYKHIKAFDKEVFGKDKLLPFLSKLMRSLTDKQAEQLQLFSDQYAANL